MKAFLAKHIWPISAVLGSVGIVVATVLVVHALSSPAFGAELGSRSLQLADNQASSTTNYQLSFTPSNAGMLGSISVQFCANDPLPADTCTMPGGFDISHATLVSQTGISGFAISTRSTVNQLILTRTAATATVSQVSFELSGVVNPSSPGSYYARVQTYASSDGSGNASDYGGIAFSIVNAITITAEVPPYLIFCTAITISTYDCASADGNYIDFGALSSSHASSGSSQFMVATNAGDGYAISVNGTTLTSGNNVITPLSNGDVSRPGTSQFGFNLVANSTPADGQAVNGPGTTQPVNDYAQANTYRFVPGDTLVSSDSTNEVRRFTSSYIVNVPVTQPAGVYVSTITYICLANF